MIYEPSDYTASFSSLAARNATFLLALILIASLVAGFRPIRAGRFTGPELLQSPEDVPGVTSDAFKLAFAMQIADLVRSDQFYATADQDTGVAWRLKLAQHDKCDLAPGRIFTQDPHMVREV